MAVEEVRKEVRYGTSAADWQGRLDVGKMREERFAKTQAAMTRGRHLWLGQAVWMPCLCRRRVKTLTRLAADRRREVALGGAAIPRVFGHIRHRLHRESTGAYLLGLVQESCPLRRGTTDASE